MGNSKTKGKVADHWTKENCNINVRFFVKFGPNSAVPNNFRKSIPKQLLFWLKDCDDDEPYIPNLKNAEDIYYLTQIGITFWKVRQKMKEIR